jgi:hypothetical protein
VLAGMLLWGLGLREVVAPPAAAAGVVRAGLRTREFVWIVAVWSHPPGHAEAGRASA